MTCLEAICSMSEEGAGKALAAMQRLLAGDNDGLMAVLATMTPDDLKKLEAALKTDIEKGMEHTA